MRNSVQPDLASPVVVAAHDAGAANLIIGWLRDRRDIEIRTCLAGPAAVLWSAAFGEVEIVPLSDALEGAAVLISGTSYASCLEHQARCMAKERRIPCVGVIDHWVNYPDRFIREGARILPDEIWVADQDALAIAAACFPGVAVRQQPNFYLAGLVTQVLALAVGAQRSMAPRVLYALEPIRHPWAAGGVAGEFQALDYFVSHAQSLGLEKTTEIRLRPHPSDPAGKYDDWLSSHSEWNLSLDPSSGLTESIAWADTVVGCETYALVVGLAAGRRVVSSLPPQAPRCRLPMKDIIHLRDIPAPNHAGSA